MPIEAPVAILNAPLSGKTASEPGLTASSGDFDTFLRLLTAQLRNQDPLSPLEGTEFVAQLATFSSVEQLIGVNDRVDSLNATVTGAAISNLSQWIGQAVSVTDGSFRATGGAVTFVAPQPGAGEAVEAVISTPSGNVLRCIAVFPDVHGNARWDGRDNDGNVVAPQDLRLTLRVTGETGTTEAPGEVLTDVLAVRGTANGVVVDLADGRAVAPDTIGRVQSRPPA